MGLDMYLTRKQYVKDWDHTPEHERRNAEVKIRGKKIDTKSLTHLEFEAMYWRKANQIHKWFVENVQDGEDNCSINYVPIEKLRELRDLCLYIMKDKDKASELLPTAEGFFFGSTEYDEFYFEDVSDTYDVLKHLTENYPRDEYYYQSSW